MGCFGDAFLRPSVPCQVLAHIINITHSIIPVRFQISFVESPDEISRTLELCPFNKCSRTTSRDVGMYLGDDPTHTSRPEIATIAHLLVPYRHRKSLNLHAILLEGLTFAAADERFGCLGRTK